MHNDGRLLRSNQRTIWINVDEAMRNDTLLQRQLSYAELSYTHSLTSQVVNAILPVASKTRHKSFRVSLSSPDRSMEEQVASALERVHYGYESRELSGSIYMFFRSCAQSIMYFQEAAFEIVFVYPLLPFSPLATGRPLDFFLVPITARTVVRSLGMLVQRLPARIAKERALPRSLALNQERILLFHPPNYVKETLGQMMEALAVLSSPLLPDFYLQELTGKSRHVPFDIEQFHNTQDLALAQVTRSIGWTPQNFLVDGKILEHYWWHRYLLFERFKIELRNSMLATLNTGLEVISREFGRTIQLAIDGLPTMDDVRSAQEGLSSGRMPLSEIGDRFRNY